MERKGCVKLYFRFLFNKPCKYTLKTVTANQVAVNKIKYDLLMLIDINLCSAIIAI